MESLAYQKEVNSMDFYNFPKYCFIIIFPTSDKILTLEALLYLRPTSSLKAELSTTASHICAALSVAVKLTGKAPGAQTTLFNRPQSQVRSQEDL